MTNKQLTRMIVMAMVFLSPVLAAAGTTADAANTAAAQMVKSLEAASLGKGSVVTLTPFEGDIGGEFANALAAALRAAGGPRVIDKKALQAAAQEAALDMTMMDADAMAELAGAMGAHAMITGSVTAKADARSATVRAVTLIDGAVVATGSVTWTSDGEALSSEATTLDAQLRRLADRVVRGLEALDGELRYQRFAVLPFEEVGASTEDKELGLLVSSELTTLLQRDHGLMMVERSQIAKLIDEMALGQTGLVDPEKAAEVGRLAGAHGLVLGAVAEAGDRYKVTTRVAASATGTILLADSIDLPAGDLVALSSEAVVLRTRTGAIYRSLLLPGWGQLYNRQPIKGGAFVAAEVLAIGAAVAFHFRGAYFHKKYEDARDADANFEGKIERAEDNYGYRNIFIYTAIGIHLINIADAFFNGKSFDSAAVGGPSGAGFIFEW